MESNPVLRMLDRHLARWPEDEAKVEAFRAFVQAHADCLFRTCVPGHLTASAYILSPGRDRALFTHHRKLDRWLQLGGHADGDADLARVALREAHEESGMERFEFLPPAPQPLSIDLDVHGIPAHGAEPAHLHYDVRFLLVAEDGQDLVRSDESHELRWFARHALEEATREESVLRLERRAKLVDKVN